MKRFILAFVAFTMLFASCTKEIENPSQTGNSTAMDDIILNITVSDFNGTDDSTRAYIKTGWSDGDVIKIWFDTNDGSNPDFAIKYNGSQWVEDKSVTLSGNLPAEGENHYCKAIYDGSVKVAAKDDYTFAASTLTMNIHTWTFLTKLQVVVTGITASDGYTLACDRFSPYKGYTVGAEGITATIEDSDSPVSGIANTDGVAFVFADSDLWDSEGLYKFTLTPSTGSPEFFNANVTIQNPDANNSKIKGLKVAESKFVTPQFVDLGLSVDWATFNVGATKPEEYGGYYQWAGTKDVTSTTYNLTANNCPYNTGDNETKCWTKYVRQDDNSFWAGEGPCDNKEVLDPDDDVAHVKWGGDWYMPTAAEVDELNNCAWEPTTENSISGYKVTGPNGNFIFLPAAGFREAKNLNEFDTVCNYWSSTLSPNDSRCGWDGSYSQSRYRGLSVRPVHRNISPAE